MAAGPNAGPTSTDYVVHHLTHLNTTGEQQRAVVDFSIINLDSVFWSIAMGVLAAWFLWRGAKMVTTGVPNRFVGAVESLVEFVHEQARSIVKGDLTYVAPLALISFIWIVLMNAMDLVPVDLIPRIWEGVYWALGLDPHHAYQRVVATADLNVTLGMSLTILLVSLYTRIKVDGVGGFIHGLLAAPFGDKWYLAPFNLLLQLIEYAAKTISLGMRLFGNMFAGELLFILIALLGATGAIWGFGLHFLTGFAWAVFHLLIITLQGFIFMMLTLVYIGQAHEGH